MPTKNSEPEDRLANDFAFAVGAEKSKSEGGIIVGLMRQPGETNTVATLLKRQAETGDRNIVLRLLNCALNDTAKTAG